MRVIQFHNDNVLIVNINTPSLDDQPNKYTCILIKKNKSFVQTTNTFQTDDIDNKIVELIKYHGNIKSNTFLN